MDFNTVTNFSTYRQVQRSNWWMQGLPKASTQLRSPQAGLLRCGHNPTPMKLPLGGQLQITGPGAHSPKILLRNMIPDNLW